MAGTNTEFVAPPVELPAEVQTDCLFVIVEPGLQGILFRMEDVLAGAGLELSTMTGSLRTHRRAGWVI